MAAAGGNEATVQSPTTWTAASPLTVLPGVGPVVARRLAAAGLRTLRDLLQFFPRRYRPLRELIAPVADAVGTLVRLQGTVRSVRSAWLPGRRSMVTFEFASADGTPFHAAFFNQPWLRKNWPPGTERGLEGQLERDGRRSYCGKRALPLPMAPDRAPCSCVIPRSRAWGRRAWWSGSAPCWRRSIGRRCRCRRCRPDSTSCTLPPRELFLAMHRPTDVATHERARLHFAVREAVALFAAVEQARRARTARQGWSFATDAPLAERIRARLPFALTADQDLALAALFGRLRGPAAMGALLQGDVGTGKTAVAVAVALAVLARGGQVAFLAPTEILAAQQAAAVAAWLGGSNVEVILLTAALTRAERQAIGERLRTGGRHLVFGTHALLSASVAFACLALVVIDEQHRFGVDQRMALVQKGKDPHVLVMTATPIPRTLALTMFGDLDVVTLRSRPPGRRPVPARFLATDRWPRVLRSIARAIRRGGRVFVVCPAVGEDGEKGGVVRMQQVLATRFKTALVHGRLPLAERQAAIAAFARGDTDVLIGTTVLEVGIDVPAATLMVVAAAERFGIGQLHQLRGRVGRGRRRGLCILCGVDGERVRAVSRTHDGFELAEADLALRGSGELLGTAQSGFAELRALDPVDDLGLLLRVRAAVRDR
ncbi:MAG: DEAD/DEAH box helicase [Planctomycetes bacterium]|nr:DEAD/DEAH box helicase [Planctomycetota bacterium]